MPSSVVKDPQAILDYGVDWTSWLEGGDTLSQSTWTIAGPDATLVFDAAHPAQQDAQRTKVWLAGGTVDAVYDLTNRVVTAAGRQDDRTLKVAIRER